MAAMHQSSTDHLKASINLFLQNPIIYIVGGIIPSVLPITILLMLVAMPPAGILMMLVLPPAVYGLAALCAAEAPEKPSMSSLWTAFSSVRQFVRAGLFFIVMGAYAVLSGILLLLFEAAVFRPESPLRIAVRLPAGEFLVGAVLIIIAVLSAELVLASLVRYVKNPDLSVSESLFEEIGGAVRSVRKTPARAAASAVFMGFLLFATGLTYGLIFPLTGPILFLYLSEGRRRTDVTGGE